MFIVKEWIQGISYKVHVLYLSRGEGMVFLETRGSVPNGGDHLKYRMTGAGQWRRIFNTSRVKEQVWLITIWSVYFYIFLLAQKRQFFVPRGKRSDWISINVFFFFVNSSQT